MSSLLFIAGPHSGRRYDLTPSSASVIGRRSECQVCVPDMRVSRQHARLANDEGDVWVIEDLGSNNGTFVNGTRILRPTELKNGDEVRIADHHIRVELAVAAGSKHDSQLTVLDMNNPRIYKSSSETDSVRFWRGDTVAGPVRETQELLKRKVVAMSSILELSSHSNDPKEVLDTLVRSLFDMFPQTDAAGVLAPDEKTGAMKVLAHRTRGTPLPIGDLAVPRTIIASVIEDGRGVLLRERGVSPDISTNVPTRAESPVPDAPEGSRMGAPLRAGGQVYGVVYVESHGGDFGQEDLDLLTNIATQIALSLHNAKLQVEVAQQRRVERDLRVARQIQRSLLPAKTPNVVGLEFAVHYEPALQIGGDFYDFVWHDDTHLAIVIGDVAGKAISAALYMARLTSELRLRAAIARTPGRLLARVNEEMIKLGDDGMFATVAYCIYDLETRTLLFTNAGHMVPLLRRDRQVYPLNSTSAHVVPIGVVPSMEVGEARVQLHSGDTLILTTDGVHEARNAAGKEYGADRLARRIRAARGGPEDIINAVLRDIDDHVGDAQQADDTTILAMTVGRRRARRSTDTMPEVPIVKTDAKLSHDE